MIVIGTTNGRTGRQVFMKIKIVTAYINIDVGDFKQVFRKIKAYIIMDAGRQVFRKIKIVTAYINIDAGDFKQVFRKIKAYLIMDEGEFKFVAGRMGFKPILSSSNEETNISSSGRQVFRKNIGNRLKNKAKLICVD